MARNLRLWRIKRNLSQEEAAQQSGVSRDTISRAERGRGIQQQNLERLAKTYGLANTGQLYVSADIRTPNSQTDFSGANLVGPTVLNIGAVEQEGLLMAPMFSALPERIEESDPSYLGQSPVRPRFGRVGDVALVTITDDSMYPRLEQGALLIVNTALTTRSQDKVFCALPDGTRAIRVYRADNDGRRVEPANASWGQGVRLDDGVKILGVVVGFGFETPAAKRLVLR
jgi:transcriptional regulator with XRE-family HTH domain